MIELACKSARKLGNLPIKCVDGLRRWGRDRWWPGRLTPRRLIRRIRLAALSLLLLACCAATDAQAQTEDAAWNVSLRGGAAVDGEELFRGIQFGWWRRVGGETWWAGLRYAQYRATTSEEGFGGVALYSVARNMQLSLRARFPGDRWTPFASLGGGVAGGEWGDGGVVQADVGLDYAVTSQFDASIQLSAARAPGPWVAGLLVGAVVSF